uniref:Uncharacterized protein n=1 Tax=Haptolina brevifila TaxID=156173 RepID=A0A7S2GJ53_9EUKA|mmetsp:Transcript_39904/g.79868  ORF Transcript_39904/g.79868 Transcript_39904/m.79868 type:complete len:327 (+) Transcript_39904:44-1024(+)|eukprot:CAMPEP_0174724822 /NCGR_PEP_ID=MMETSP1094-20130205/44220_1 /TAXON_ID=156173 /ORGANISM="Chrysochromulina brevifilum, Strain UTEX LB 985" /LENGTH=326 /DNA_ID=CAMNT_0015926103 /DNA_START=39 /DNA_END=1019 /DNA_ORIENTATION=-
MGCGGSKVEGERVEQSGQKLKELPTVGPKTAAIDCSENELPELPAWIGDLKELKELDANANELTALPEAIIGCVNLEKLYVYKNKIKELPAELPPALTELNFFNNQIRKLPPSIGKLSCLEEVNFSSNKLMMTQDAMFANWSTVKVLNMYDNNLVRFGSLATLLSLEELRLNANNLEAMPELSKSHPALKIIEVHKNRIANIPDEYFNATPALERLSIWANQLEAVPSSICGCNALLGLQVHDNKLTALPGGRAWPPKLQTLFVQENLNLKTLPSELKACPAMFRCNVSKTALDADGVAVADAIKAHCLANQGGIFWDQNGMQHKA